ncbi:glutathione S-transferase-like protein [Crepidotus variabilis]|uniref:glutathione transferase n=1 Tax=Crepidotus variabilis TaxID=179855 RepID=A0A9P6E612_9AGAR|nr:glutathione S-transferase-like protein [Crepidotus variabilis]
MVLKLYGVAGWGSTNRILVILREKGVPYELHEVDTKNKEHKSAAFREKQPFGLTPYLDDDGFILYESRAISYYIAAKYANQGTQGLIPTDLKANALFQQALSNELCNFDSFARPLILGVLYQPQGVEVDHQAVDKMISALDEQLDVYDKILSKQRYLAGNELTLADLFHLTSGAVLPICGYHGLKTKPNVARWWNEISSRPSWQATK